MNTPLGTHPRSTWSRILVIVGGIAMLVGGVDPLEGSLAILPGSGLVVLGTLLDPDERRWLAFRVWMFVLIAIGVGAMWGLTAVGGFGGTSKYSMWWGVLILPYLIGWSLNMWGPGSPRWLTALGTVVGLWYLAILTMALRNAGHPHGDMGSAPVIVLGAIGLLTVCGCVIRLARKGTR
jgi:hypothetical protein